MLIVSETYLNNVLVERMTDEGTEFYVNGELDRIEPLTDEQLSLVEDERRYQETLATAQPTVEDRLAALEEVVAAITPTE